MGSTAACYRASGCTWKCPQVTSRGVPRCQEAAYDLPASQKASQMQPEQISSWVWEVRLELQYRFGICSEPNLQVKRTNLYLKGRVGILELKYCRGCLGIKHSSFCSSLHTYFLLRSLMSFTVWFSPANVSKSSLYAWDEVSFASLAIRSMSSASCLCLGNIKRGKGKWLENHHWFLFPIQALSLIGLIQAPSQVEALDNVLLLFYFNNNAWMVPEHVAITA